MVLVIGLADRSVPDAGNRWTSEWHGRDIERRTVLVSGHDGSGSPHRFTLSSPGDLTHRFAADGRIDFAEQMAADAGAIHLAP